MRRHSRAQRSSERQRRRPARVAPVEIEPERAPCSVLVISPIETLVWAASVRNPFFVLKMTYDRREGGAEWVREAA